MPGQHHYDALTHRPFRKGWEADDELRYRELLADLYGGLPLGDFITRYNPKYPPPPHLRTLLAVLERTRHEEVRAIVSMPPRHRKTTTCANMLAWSLSKDPSLQHAYVTYNERQAKKKVRMSRDIALRAGVTSDPARLSSVDWGVLLPDGMRGGGIMATGTLGSLTGEGVTGVLLIDDPVKNRKDADSPTHRDDVWEWFTDVALTRMEPGGSIVIVMTRWHEDDLAGRLLRGDFDEIAREIGIDPPRYEEIRLAALCEDVKDGTDRELGDALWPENYPRHKLLKQKVVNPWSFEAMYQQNPRPKEGKLFSATPERFNLDHLLGRGAEGFRMIIACDTAASEKTKADHWAAVLLWVQGWTDRQEAWIVDVLRFRADPIAGAARIKDFYDRWQIPLVIEGGVVGKAPIAALRRQYRDLHIEEIAADRDKYTRAQPVAAAWNGGRVRVPWGVPWADALIRECSNFTGQDGAEDDQVDALAHAWNYLTDVREWVPEYEQGLSHMPGDFGSLG